MLSPSTVANDRPGQKEYIDSAEWAIVESRVATVDAEQVQQCVATTNFFVDYTEEQGTAGLSEKAFDLFSELKSKMDAGASQTAQLEVMYALAKEQVFYEVTDCILTILAYERAKAQGLVGGDDSLDSDLVQDLALEIGTEDIGFDIAAANKTARDEKIRFYGLAGAVVLLVGTTFWFTFIRRSP